MDTQTKRSLLWPWNKDNKQKEQRLQKEVSKAEQSRLTIYSIVFFSNHVACKYISKPHLINGYKYDLRVYVLVSSFDPLRVYVFEEGLVRFATEKYSTNLKGLRKRFVHLTNYSVNKKAEGYTALNDKKDEEFCAKWDFRTLRKKFTELGLDFEKVFKGVHDVIIKGLISIEPHIVNNLNR